jgi:myosin heavy subunit
MENEGEREALGLTTPAAFRYLGDKIAPEAATVHAAQYLEMMAAMDGLGFDPNDVESLLRVLAGVLHLGQIEFAPASNVCSPHAFFSFSKLSTVWVSGFLHGEQSARHRGKGGGVVGSSAR